MLLKHWEIGNADKETAKFLAEECNIDPLAALIAYERGFSDPADLEQFISDEINLSDPYEYKDIETAAEVILESVHNGEKIAVYGDYDCDGITSTALLYDCLKRMDASVETYLPNRFTDGYGMSISGVDRLAEKDVCLIVTVDNGISCAEEIAYAKSKGIKVVVTDHHIPPDTLPDAEAVVDPFRADCPSSYKTVCGVTVAFQLACVLNEQAPEQLLPRYADLLAIGTVADVMPLTEDNRTFVRYGIEKIKQSPRMGISALLNVAGIDRQTLSAGKISFGIVPRLNAAGRMGSAERALELLLATDIKTALSLANELDDENNRRKQIEQDILKKAVKTIEENHLQYQRVIVVSGKEWHSGILGIVASRIMERYGKPTIVFSEEGDEAKGSGRSFSGFSLYDAISSCQSVLVAFGGHELAAGLQIKTDCIKEFSDKINQYARSFDFPFRSLHLDLKLNPAALSVDTAAALSVLEPFGNENPTPLFGIFGCMLENITAVGNGKHLRLTFRKTDSRFQAMLFSVSSDTFPFSVGDCLDLAVTLSINVFEGNENLSVQIKELRPSGFSEETVFAEYAAFHDAMSTGKRISAEPKREEAVELYRFIMQKKVLDDFLIWKFLPKFGFLKTKIYLQAFLQLGIARLDGQTVSVISDAPKCDLMRAPIFKLLSGKEEA